MEAGLPLSWRRWGLHTDPTISGMSRGRRVPEKIREKVCGVTSRPPSQESPGLRIAEVSCVTSQESEKGRSSPLLTDKPVQTIIFGNRTVPLQQDKQTACPLPY